MRRYLFLSLLLTLGISSFALTGCDKSDNSSSSSTSTTEATVASEDAAAVVASAVASEEGGLTDQLTDVADFVHGGMIQSVPQLAGGGKHHTRNGVVKEITFNSTDTTWTIKLERSLTNNKVTSSWTREYQYWFSKNGVKQQSYTDANGTADKVEFVIVSAGCTGTFKSPNMTHELKHLEGSMLGSIDLVANTVTVNSVMPYKRMGLDSISTRNAIRTSDHTLTLVLADVVLPIQYATTDTSCVRPTSGTITGEYVAEVTFKNNSLYSEKTVTRNFTIDFSTATGTEIPVHVRDGNKNHYSGKFNLKNGQLQ
ncbi:MAG: hypothetical protein HGB19_06100 [Chlorobiales bacterium]|jgi:hypothetical protein|nr:hypothetical protein [Chlorobiales bacterium]